MMKRLFTVMILSIMVLASFQINKCEATDVWVEHWECCGKLKL